MDLKLKNHKVLITGGSQGIGFSIARSFVNEGALVSICSRSENKINRALEELDSPNVFGFSVDVGITNQLAGWITNSAEKLGGLDTLICNVSGINQPGTAGWKSQFDLNILSTVNAVEKVTP